MEVVFVGIRRKDGVTLIPTFETPQGVCSTLQDIAVAMSLQRGVAFSSQVARELAYATREMCDRLSADGTPVDVGAGNLKFIYRWVYNLPISDIATARL